MPITKTDNRSAVVRVILVAGMNIPRGKNKQSNVHCSLQVGKQKENAYFQSKLWWNQRCLEFVIVGPTTEESGSTTLKPWKMRMFKVSCGGHKDAWSS